MSTTQMPAAGALSPLLDKIKALPKTALLVGGALLVALVVAVALWNNGPSYKVLFSNLGERDGGAIITALGQMNVPYRFADGSAALMVPADKVHETRLALAAQGLPRGGSVGFELLDDAKFGVSQFTEQVNYQRALEGELARSIEAVHAVQSARVHLAIPRQTMFVRNRQAPSASVLINLYPGRVLDDTQVAAVAHLVSSSVPELLVANISIVDQHGRLLSLPGGEGRGMDVGQVRQVRDLELAYAQRIEAILTPLLGPGNARAQVNAQLDFSRREETSEVYRPNQDPNQAAIRSRQTSEAMDGTRGPAQGVPGALTNQPPADPAAPIVNPPTAGNAQDAQPPNAQGMRNTALQSGSERREATTNYEVDRTITHMQHAVGTVSRLSVAVIVNHIPDADGQLGPVPADQLAQMRELVKEAMGYSEERGDSLHLMNGEFVGPADIRLPWWQDPMYIALAKTLAGWLLVLLAALWLWLGIARPLLRRHLQPAGAGAGTDTAARAISAQQEEEEEAAAAMQRARQQSRYEDNLQTARDLAMKDPRAVASVIRSWMEKMSNDALQRSAILMMTLGEDAAAEVFKHMNPREVQLIGSAMASLKQVSRQEVSDVLEAFREEADQFMAVNLGTDEYIRAVLTKALGSDRAAGLIEDILDAQEGGAAGIDALNWLDANTVAELIREEHPQIIATILVHLERDRAAEVLALLTERLRNDVVLRIATFGGVQPSALNELTEVLNELFVGQGAKRSRMGGVRTAAEIINMMASTHEEAVIASLRERDADLTQKIVDEMFVFENLAEIEDRGIQLLLKEIENDTLMVALKGAPEALREKFMRNMSNRAAEMLREDLESMGPVRLSQVEAEQKQILQVARRLAETGQIALGVRGDDAYV